MGRRAGRYFALGGTPRLPAVSVCRRVRGALWELNSIRLRRGICFRLVLRLGKKWGHARWFRFGISSKNSGQCRAKVPIAVGAVDRAARAQ